MQEPCDLLSVSAGARTLVPRRGGLRRRHLAAALDGSAAVVGLGSRRWTLETGGARPPFLALAPDQHAIESRCRPTGSPCRDLDLRADLDGPQRGATVLGGERDPIAPVGWTPDDCSASHRDDSILSNASRLDALTKWWGEGPPRSSHVGLLGSGLSQAPTAQRPCREVVRLPRCRDGRAAPKQPDLDLRPPGRSRQIVQPCPVGRGHLTTGRGRKRAGRDYTRAWVNSRAAAVALLLPGSPGRIPAPRFGDRRARGALSPVLAL